MHGNAYYGQPQSNIGYRKIYNRVETLKVRPVKERLKVVMAWTRVGWKSSKGLKGYIEVC